MGRTPSPQPRRAHRVRSSLSTVPVASAASTTHPGRYIPLEHDVVVSHLRLHPRFPVGDFVSHTARMPTSRGSSSPTTTTVRSLGPFVNLFPSCECRVSGPWSALGLRPSSLVSHGQTSHLTSVTFTRLFPGLVDVSGAVHAICTPSHAISCNPDEHPISESTVVRSYFEQKDSMTFNAWTASASGYVQTRSDSSPWRSLLLHSNVTWVRLEHTMPGRGKRGPCCAGCS